MTICYKIWIKFSIFVVSHFVKFEWVIFALMIRDENISSKRLVIQYTFRNRSIEFLLHNFIFFFSHSHSHSQMLQTVRLRMSCDLKNVSHLTIFIYFLFFQIQGCGMKSKIRRKSVQFKFILNWGLTKLSWYAIVASQWVGEEFQEIFIMVAQRRKHFWNDGNALPIYVLKMDLFE